VHLETCSITAYNYISKLAPLWPTSASPNSLNHGMQVYLQTCSIMAYKLVQSWPPSASPNFRSITASKCISKLARSWPTSVFPHLFNYSLQGGTIMACKCISKHSLDYSLQVHISKVTPSWPASVSPNSFHYGLPVCTMMASKFSSKLAQSWPWSVSLSSLDHRFQPYLASLSSTICSQSR